MVGYARRETRRAHRIVPEGECDDGGVGEADGYEIDCKSRQKARCWDSESLPATK